MLIWKVISTSGQVNHHLKNCILCSLGYLCLIQKLSRWTSFRQVYKNKRNCFSHHIHYLKKTYTDFCGPFRMDGFGLGSVFSARGSIDLIINIIHIQTFVGNCVLWKSSGIFTHMFSAEHCGWRGIQHWSLQCCFSVSSFTAEQWLDWILFNISLLVSIFPRGKFMICDIEMHK